MYIYCKTLLSACMSHAQCGCRAISSRRLVPGDVVVVLPGKATCDMVLLQGNCLVEESMLSGEVTSIDVVIILYRKLHCIARNHSLDLHISAYIALNMYYSPILFITFVRPVASDESTHAHSCIKTSIIHATKQTSGSTVLHTKAAF